MTKKFILILIFFVFKAFGQTPSTADFVNKLKVGKDTLTIYTRQSNCDSVVLYKFQIYKVTGDYVIRTFRPLGFKLPKRCYDLVKHKPDKLNFELIQSCGHPAESIKTVEEIEFAIRNIKNNTGTCAYRFRFTLKYGNKKYSNKKATCRPDIAKKIDNYFICSTTDK